MITKENEFPRILVMAAVEQERQAILRGIGGDSEFIDVVAGGVGPVAAAIATTKILLAAKEKYKLVISAGIGGGFVDRAEIGSIVVADAIVAADSGAETADSGAETADGFLPLDEMGFGVVSVRPDLAKVTWVTNTLHSSGMSVHVGSILTLSTVTGTAATAQILASRIPGAASEAMEGFGVALAAADQGIPVLEIRAISNLVGPRDRASWRIEEAMAALTEASRILKGALIRS